MVFCPLLKKSVNNSYLKFLDFAHLLVVDNPMKYFFQQFLCTLSDSTFRTPSIFLFFREAAKNGHFLVARPLRGGEGKGLATKKNTIFLQL